ncbi:TrbC/VirB2 family protein [Luteibacter sp. NPDC031894]|jgi:type IV secretion system protein VirB2|uniref:TrbC/VirB2 family protein n=1 Tax=Luteibacter sp. NPDC031894 TaxID=3390572 RepID=UPI003D054D56
MSLSTISSAIAKSKHPLVNTLALFAVVALFAIPELAFAQDTREKVCGFFTNIKGILNAASIVVVTVAVIFSGYQIAFAHKRISDVTPALIGGVLIGAAAQIAKTVVQGDDAGASGQCTDAGNVGMIIHAMQTAMQFLHFHA